MKKKVSIKIEYRIIKKLREGTLSEVFKAQSLKSGDYKSIKCLKTHYNSIKEVNKLREVRAKDYHIQI